MGDHMFALCSMGINRCALHFCIVIWGGLRVDYIFELLYMGWIRVGLHSSILLHRED